MNARKLVQLAMGSPAEPDAEAALGILFEVLHADARAVADANPHDPLALALTCRLEALKAFADEHFKVQWKVAQS